MNMTLYLMKRRQFGNSRWKQAIIIIGMFQNHLDDSSSEEEEKAKPLPNPRAANSPSPWKDLFLREELIRSLKDAAFDFPSEIQRRAIPVVLKGADVFVQAKSGVGKTAVFVISILSQLAVDKDGEYKPQQCLVLCHCRELAHQIYKEFHRFGKYFRSPALRFACFFGGLSIQANLKDLSNLQTAPHIIIGTPGRLLDLYLRGYLNLKSLRSVVVDECDKLIVKSDMRFEVEKILKFAGMDKQVIMVSATMDVFTMKVCGQFMRNPQVVSLEETELVLSDLTQYFIKIGESAKFERLCHLLDTIAFNQVIVFVNRVERARKLTQMLGQKLFNPICIHSRLKQEERIKNYDLFKGNGSRLLVATDLFGRGIDIERVNLVINYDFPEDQDTYLHRVGRAGRFNSKGLAINFLRAECGGLDDDDTTEAKGRSDDQVLQEVQKKLKVRIRQLPRALDNTLFM